MSDKCEAPVEAQVRLDYRPADGCFCIPEEGFVAVVAVLVELVAGCREGAVDPRALAEAERLVLFLSDAVGDLYGDPAQPLDG